MSFDEAVQAAVERDARYAAEAYRFLRDALDYTLKALQRARSGQAPQHVSGRELCLGFREYALQQFGPMVPTILDDWGIRNTRDIGEMVFLLIDLRVFNKSRTDRVEDFDDVFLFHDAFEKPYLPVRQTRPAASPPSGLQS